MTKATDPDLSITSNSSKTDLNSAHHTEHVSPPSQNETARRASVAAKLRNPLAGLTEEQVIADVDAWCVEKGLTEHQDAFRKGALIARMGQRDDGYEYVSQLSEEEKNIFRNEQAEMPDWSARPPRRRVCWALLVNMLRPLCHCGAVIRLDRPAKLRITYISAFVSRRLGPCYRPQFGPDKSCPAGAPSDGDTADELLRTHRQTRRPPQLPAVARRKQPQSRSSFRAD